MSYELDRRVRGGMVRTALALGRGQRSWFCKAGDDRGLISFRAPLSFLPGTRLVRPAPPIESLT
eukprot:COSAG04_NODE_429_length_14527_cov_119.154422_6_plen_64_part_00